MYKDINFLEVMRQKENEKDRKRNSKKGVDKPIAKK